MSQGLAKGRRSRHSVLTAMLTSRRNFAFSFRTSGARVGSV